MSQRMSREVASLVERWTEALHAEGDSDYLVAEVMAETLSVYGGDDRAVVVFLCDALGITAHPTHRKYLAMGRAFGKVDDRAVWKAVRWQGVSQLVRITGARKLRAACAKVREAQESSRIVTQAMVREIVLEQVPDAFTPRPPRPSTAPSSPSASSSAVNVGGALAGEVQSLREKLRKAEAERDQLRTERDQLRAKLDELLGAMRRVAS